MSEAHASRAGGAIAAAPVAATRSRPLRSWAAVDRARLARAIAAAIQEWREAWGIASDGVLPGRGAGADGGLSCEEASGAAARSPCVDLPWEPLGAAAGGAWWAAAPVGAPPAAAASRVGRASPLDPLSRALFGDPTGAGAQGPGRISGPRPTLASEIAKAAWHDARTRLAALLGARGDAATPPARPPPETWRPWSGALVLTLPWWGDAIALVVEGARVERFLGAPAARLAAPDAGRSDPLVPVWGALARRAARLRVQTRPFELELGTLAGLRVGDVLRTAHTLDVPLTVTVDGADGSGAAAVCAGFLGKSGAMCAVELMRAGAAPPPADRGERDPPAPATRREDDA